VKRRAFLENSFMISALGGAGLYLMSSAKDQSKPVLNRARIARAVPLVPDDERLAERLLRQQATLEPKISLAEQEIAEIIAHHSTSTAQATSSISTLAVNDTEEIPVIEEGIGDEAVDPDAPVQQAKSVQDKVRGHNNTFTDDVVLADADYELLLSTWERLRRVQKYVGFGHFNIIAFDDAVKFGRMVSDIGEFQPQELALLESLFYDDPNYLGFYGDRVIQKITDRIAPESVDKIPGTGHYLFRGESQEIYNRLRQDVGETLFLTSGVRSTVKQAELFLSKAIRTEGNMSKASRSLAPPAHSYHSVGDFDVGKIGLGLQNFSEEFAQTEEFRKLNELDYIKIRYTADNSVGVRFEPWHVRVV
jgi:hypothetical protein